MTRTRRIGILVLGAGLAAATVAAPTMAQAKAKGTTISTVKTKLGRVVSSSKGRAMFQFAKDSKNASTCSAHCQSVWPPVMSKSKAKAGSHVKKGHLGLTKQGQVTYYGHPLYFYVANTGTAKTKGDGLKEFGAKWYLVSPTGKTVKPKKHTGGGGGYTPVVPASAPTIDAQQEGATTTQPVLSDADGFALYALASETSTNFVCSDSSGCIPVRTPVLTDAANDPAVAGTGVTQSMLGTADRTFGSTTAHQVTYNGHPLYTYQGDTASNQDNGQWQNTAGHFWGTVFEDGTLNGAFTP
jgi:predicted lipoprotein with Yx(FWY)xxD motif